MAQRMQSNMVFGETEGSKEFTRGNSEELIDSKRETTGPAAEDFEKNVKDSNSALIGQKYSEWYLIKRVEIFERSQARSANKRHIQLECNAVGKKKDDTPKHEYRGIKRELSSAKIQKQKIRLPRTDEKIADNLIQDLMILTSAACKIVGWRSECDENGTWTYGNVLVRSD